MSKRNENTNWLAKLRFNSWELEILLVGFVLVVLLQVPDRIERWITITNISLSPLTNTSDFIMNVMILPVLTLSLSVVIHIMILSLIFYLILRAFWIAIIGISSAFPDGININSLSFFKKYNNKISKINLEDPSIQLDKICSSIFAFAFLLVMLTVCIAMILVIGVILLTIGIFVFQNNLFFLLGFLVIYLFFALLYIIDLVFLSMLKKIKWKFFAVPYYYFSKMMNIITLGFIFEKLYYYFISNISIRQFLLFFSIIILINGLISIINPDQNYLFSTNNSHSKTATYRFYDDKLSMSNVIDAFLDYDYLTPRINSYIINENIVELFIPYYAGIDQLAELSCNLERVYSDSLDGVLNASKTSISFDSDDLFIRDDFHYKIDDILNCLNKFYILSINDTISIQTDLSMYIHPLFSQKGYNMVVDVTELSNGKHYLSIELNSEFNPDNAGDHILKNSDEGTMIISSQNWLEEIYEKDNFIRIPFYKSVK